MSGENPATAAEDPPPLGNGESAASDKNDAEKYGSDESREVAVTSNDVNEVKSGGENGTECAADEGANIVEADDTNKANSGSANVVGAVDVKKVDTRHEAIIEDVDVKMVETQYEANFETLDVKMVETQHEASVEAVDVGMVGTQLEVIVEAVDVKMVETQYEANIEPVDVKMAETMHEAKNEAEDVKMVDTKHEAVIEAEVVKMVDTQHEANIEVKDVKMVGTQDVKMVDTQHEANVDAGEYACQVEGLNGDNQYAKASEGEDTKMIEAKADTRNSEAQENRKPEKEGNTEEKTNHANVIKMDEKEDVCQKEDKEGKNEDSQDAKVAEADEVNMVEAKVDARNAEAHGYEKKEEMEDKMEEKGNNASIEDDVKTFGNEDAFEDAFQKEVKEGNNEDRQDARASEGDESKMVEAKADTRNFEAQENRKPEKEENTEEKTNHANGIKMDEKEDVCQEEDKEGKNEDSQDAKVAEADEVNIVEAKVDARNAEAHGYGKKEEMEDKMEEKGNNASIGNEDAFQKEVKEGNNEDRQNARASEGDEIKMVKAKTDAGNAEVEGNEKKEDKAGQTQEKKSNASIETEELKMPDKEYACEEKDKNLKNEGIQDGKSADGEDMSVEGKNDAEIAEVIGSRKNGELKFKVEQKKNDANSEAENVIMVDKENARQTEDKVRKDDDSQDANPAECEDIKTVEAKIDAGNAAIKETVRKETKEEHNEEKESIVNAQADDVKIVDKEDACWKEDKERKTEDSHGVKAAEGGETMMAESKSAAIHAEVKENGQDKGGNKTEEKQIICMEKQDKDKMEPAEVDNNGEPKRKKARIVTEKDHGKDKKQDGSKSREAKNLLSVPSTYSADRPVRSRKTVERLVEVIEKDPSGSFIVEKGRGTPLKNIPDVAKRISNKQPAELKLLHQILFGRFGRAIDFKYHILEFSGIPWHDSDEKHRAKAKEKLDKCSIVTLLDLCDLLAIPISRANSIQDIVAKLLDFIAEPRAKDDSNQGSNSRKRKREMGSATKNPEGAHKRSRKKLDGEHTSRKRWQKYSESESDEDAEERYEEDNHMKSDREENKDDGEEVDSEQEDRYDRRKLKAGKKSVDGKGSTAKTERKAITGISPKRAPVATLSKCLSRVSSLPKSSKDKQRSAVDLSVVSRKSKPIIPKRTTNSKKEINETRSSGKGSTSKGKSAEAEQAPPSKDELQKTIVQLLKIVDMDNVTFSDVFMMLGKCCKADISSMKETVKDIILDELVKLAKVDED